MTQDIHIFGIRHHGPGSARSLRAALETLQPDIVLVEGPPDADQALPLLVHEQMRPPVALLVYAPDDPKYGAYYPFTTFSPEYQAIEYAVQNGIPARFMDLAMTHRMALLKRDVAAAEATESDESTPENTPDAENLLRDGDEETSPADMVRFDPLGELAKAAGHRDGERWWEQIVEQRQDATGIFEAVLEAMGALRETLELPERPDEDLREASMRHIIRQAQAEGYQTIAVVCGAWHAPVLRDVSNVAADEALLAALPRLPMSATWIPWTNGRLTMVSGYGAGVRSPGWYQHLWDTHNRDVAVMWLSKVAQLLRSEDLDASPAQVIDAVRLADTLASMRGRATPGLDELNEAALTVLCFGNHAPMQLIADKLIVGETMGDIPDDTPMVPLMRDLKHQQKALRLQESPKKTTLNLDLRQERGLARSQLLHRLVLLEIDWGRKDTRNSKPGTYQEYWGLQWQPAMTLQIIEKSTWGNTVIDAATAFATHTARESKQLPILTKLAHDVLLSDLPDAVPPVVNRLDAVATKTGDVRELMLSLPPLANVLTYGNVRKPDAAMVSTVVSGMVNRVCIGLPTECVNLDDEAAQTIYQGILMFDNALRLMNDDDYTQRWRNVLKTLMTQNGVHGLIRGRCCRILLDYLVITHDEAVTQMRLALDGVLDPPYSAAWLMGFLPGSGLILLHDDTLLDVVDDWVASLLNEDFEVLLPLLRRTFATFTAPELRAIGRKIAGLTEHDSDQHGVQIDENRANAVLDTISELLGIKLTNAIDEASS